MSYIEPRYSFGGDEFIFVELSEEMNLEANFRGTVITNKLREKNLEGVIDICPSNASYLVRLDPDIINPTYLIDILKEIEKESKDLKNIEIHTRVVDVPVLFDDQWTNEVVMRFRDRHQDPNSTDLEYSAKINGYKNKEDFIKALTDYPYIVSMVGFVPGLPWCFQIVPREKQIEVPKYIRPRTFTHERTFGFGGAFAVIYPVQGAGGYQMFGVSPTPVYSLDQRLYDFKNSIVFPKQGDIFRYRAITMEEFDSTRKKVEDGIFRYLIKELSFIADEVIDNPTEFSKKALRRLYHD
jgi:urea carboxylase